MRRLIPLASLLLGLTAPVLPAQIISVYGTFSPTHLSNVQTGTAYSFSGATVNSTTFWTEGIGGGVTLRLLPLGPVQLGLDLRGSTRPGTVGVDTALAGLKLAVKPPLIGLKFYVQGSGGYLATRTVNNTTYIQDPIPISQPYTNHYAVYEIFGGIDRPILRVLDLRLIEIGAGQGYNYSSSGISTSPTISLFTINSGLVFHF